MIFLTNEKYKKFIEYTFSVCDKFSLTRIFDQHAEENERIRKIILDNEKIDEYQLLQKYSDEYLNYIISKYYNNEKIFYKYDIEEKKNETLNFKREIQNLKNEFQSFKDFKNYYKYYENIEIEVDSYEKLNFDNFFNKVMYDERKIIVKEAIHSYLYKCFTTYFLEEYNRELIEQESILLNGKEYGVIYYFKTSSLIKKKLLEYNNIFDFSYPRNLENLCFFKNGNLWFSSVSHEKDFFLNCSNDEEYEYLIQLGIPEDCLILDKNH